MAARAVVRAIAVGGERAAKVRDREERYLVAESGGDHELIEVLERGAQLAQQGGKALGLGVVGIEAA